MTVKVAAGSGRAGRLRRTLAIAAVAGLASVGLVASPSQAQVTQCSGEISNVIIPGSVEVAGGDVCILTNVLVAGNLDVGEFADLFIDHTTVTGTLTVLAGGFAMVDDSTISSGTEVRDAFGVVATATTLTSGITVDNSTFFFSVESTHAGSLESNSGLTFIEAGQLSGGISTTGDEQFNLIDSTFAGNISVSETRDHVLICHSTINGTTALTGNSGVIQIGGEQPTPACGSNTFNGQLHVNDNHADQIQISSNLISGGLNCSGNQTAPTGSDNLVFGPSAGQCGDLTTGSSSGILASGGPTPAEVKADLEQLIEWRTCLALGCEVIPPPGTPCDPFNPCES